MKTFGPCKRVKLQVCTAVTLLQDNNIDDKLQADTEGQAIILKLNNCVLYGREVDLYAR